MASRAVCPRCHRSYDATAIVCSVDGEALVAESGANGSSPPGLPTDDAGDTPPTVTAVEGRRSDGGYDSVPALPPPPTFGRRDTLPPELRPATAPPPARGSLPPSTPRPDANDPLFRTTGPNAPVRRRTDPNLGRPLTGPQRIIGGNLSGGTPVPGVNGTFPPANGENGPRGDGSGSPWLGERLGPYRLLRQLGEGGMARIYLAEHEKLGRICAIKRLHADHFADRLTVARFLAEARAVGAIHHPNLVAAYDVVEEPTEIYLVMEYLDGRDVAQVLRTEGPLDPARAADIIAQACDGLGAVHQHNIIHRDLKPENIFLTRDPDGHERVKLLDFGVARLIGDRPQELKTRSGLTVGTPTYMSPEQATASEIDARSDIYTVGVVLYEMLCGSPPFTGAGYGDVMLMHVNDVPPRLTSRRADVPAWLDSIVTRCLEKEPSHRFASALDLAAALRAGPRATPVTQNDPRGTQRVRSIPQVKQAAPRWTSSLASSGGVLTLALVVVVGLLLALALRRGSEPSQMVTAPVLPGPAPRPTPEPTPTPPVTGVDPTLGATALPNPNAAPTPVTPVAAPQPPVVPAPPPVEPDRPPHRVKVITRPSRAEVSVSGEKACRTPCNLILPTRPGRVEIHVAATGYVEETRLVDGMEPPAQLRLRLARLPKPPKARKLSKAAKAAALAKAPAAPKAAKAAKAPKAHRLKKTRKAKSAVKATAPGTANRPRTRAVKKPSTTGPAGSAQGRDTTVDPFQP